MRTPKKPKKDFRSAEPATGNTAWRERIDGKFKRPRWSKTAFSADELMTAEPTVPQHPVGWVPDDES
ncbi:MAG TPA: hypothetical protein VGB13_00770 [Candidatus Krumholzibacteria bacterium]